MEAILTNCNDQDLLEMILAAYPDPPILNNVLEMAKRHEAAKKNSHLAKSDSKWTSSILIDGETDSETGERDSDSDGYDSDNEVLFLAKKGEETNRIYFVRKEK